MLAKKISFRNYFLTMLTIVLTLSATFLYVMAQTPSSTFYISGGLYPHGVTYTFWREGSNYFAKDGNGQLDFSGTNATTVIQNAIDTLPYMSGGYFYFKRATYQAWNIDLGNRSCLTFEGETQGIASNPNQGVLFENNDNTGKPVFTTDGTVTQNFLTFRHLGFFSHTGYNVSAFIEFNQVYNGKIQDCYFHRNTYSPAIILDGSLLNHIEQVHITYCAYGIRILDDLGESNLNTIITANINQFTQIGIDIQGSSANTIININLEANTAQTAPYGVCINATNTHTSSIYLEQVNIADHSPQIGFYVNGRTATDCAKQITFIGCAVRATQYGMQINTYSYNVTIISPFYRNIGTADLRIENTTENIVVINPATTGTFLSLAGAKTAYWYNNNTYCVIP